MKPLVFQPLGPMNVDMTGEKYGFLTVLGYAGFDMRKTRCAAMWYCKCENCGRIKKVARTGLRFGRAKSCGKKGCKSKVVKLFAPHPLAQKYNKITARRKKDKRRAIREARELAAAAYKKRLEAMPRPAEPVPAPPQLKFRRAIDTPERFQHPDLGKRGRNRQFIFSHPDTHETKMPTPFVEPDTALWMQVRA